MKNLIVICLVCSWSVKTFAQTNVITMEKSYINTKLGAIATFIKKGNPDATPVIFLHGVYFDHHLWDEQLKAISDRTVIAIDMPWHGESTENVPQKWNLENCGSMLLDILDRLKIQKIIAIGHSWGSMTILRAAHAHPEKFAAVGLCNMPFEAAKPTQKRNFAMQHTALIFKKFYIKQAAKSLFGKQSPLENPSLFDNLYASMSKISNKHIKKTDKFVIINADNATLLVDNLTIPALALKGKEDYVPTPQKIDTQIVKGGHVSPLEAKNDVSVFCKKVIDLTH
jgi:3-oxoadipate enol-lactonase